MVGVTFAVVIAFLAFPNPAHACPMCKEAVESDPRLATGYNWSILGLVSLPFVLVTVTAVQVMRALNPVAYYELTQRLRAWLWPKGWLYLSSGVAALALLFYATTPPDPATRLRLPYTALEALPAANAAPPVPRLEDRVLVVSFFASWCLPCVEQVADLAQLHREFEGEPVALVAVNAFEDYTTPPGVPHLHADGSLEYHEGAPDLPGFLEANGIILPVVASTPALSDAFGGVARIPTTFVFDQQGRLVKRYINEARGDFVRPTLEVLRRDVGEALACGRISLRLIREACTLFAR